MIALVDRALALNPNFARGWYISGGCSGFWPGSPISRSSISKPRCASARATRVRHRRSRHRASRISSAAASMRQWQSCSSRSQERSELRGDLSLVSPPATPILGRLDEAREIVARLRAITPVVMPDVSYLSQPGAPRAVPVGPAPGGRRGDMSQTRRLAAILAADVAGYSRLMGADEEGTLERLKALRRELLDPKIAEHQGRIVKTTGDGLLVEFASVVDAVRCAVAVQQAMPEREHRRRGGQPHRIAHRHQSRRRDRRGRRPLWRRRQHRRTDRSPGRCRRGVRLQYGP